MIFNGLRIDWKICNIGEKVTDEKVEHGVWVIRRTLTFRFLYSYARRDMLKDNFIQTLSDNQVNEKIFVIDIVL